MAFDGCLHYRRVIGKINYLEKSTRPDIVCAVHKCARLPGYPKMEHGNAVIWLVRYFNDTHDKGLNFKPDERSLEVYLDAYLAGNYYNKEDASEEKYTIRSSCG